MKKKLPDTLLLATARADPGVLIFFNFFCHFLKNNYICSSIFESKNTIN